MKKIFTTIVASLLVMQYATAWTGSLHAGIAAIAHDNLTEQTKKGIVEILGGRSIIYAASLPTSHNQNIAIAPNGKVLSAKKAAKSKCSEVASALLMDDIERAVAATRDPKTPKDTKAPLLKNLVAAIGDLHCPGHYIYTAEPKLREIYYLHTKDTNPRKFTELWESAAVQGTFGWKSNEFVHQLSRKTPEQVAAITAGTVTDWAERNAAEYRPLYDTIESGHHFEQSIEYRLWLNKIYPIAVEQIAVAGYRLAALLNSIF